MRTKSKLFISSFILLVCLSSVATLLQAQVVASNKYVTMNVTIRNFNQIKLLGSLTVEYVQKEGPAKLQITGSDNIVELVQCEVKNNTLQISYKDNTSITFGKQGRLKIFASSASLKGAVLQGSGDILLKDIESDDFDMSLIGSGDIVANSITCSGDLSAVLQGSGDIKISNRIQAEDVVLKLQGSGDLDVAGISARKATVTLQGSGDMNIKGRSKVDNVTVRLLGSGDLDFCDIAAREVTGELQGSGDMKLTGSTRSAILKLTNSGDIDAKGLRASEVEAQVLGSGSISCAASQRLQTKIQGSGDISYKGNPEIQASGKNQLHKL